MWPCPIVLNGPIPLFWILPPQKDGKKLSKALCKIIGSIKWSSKRYWAFKWDCVLLLYKMLFGNNHSKWVWWNTKDRFAEKHLMPTVMYGGGSLMLWADFFPQRTWEPCNVNLVFCTLIITIYMLVEWHWKPSIPFFIMGNVNSPQNKINERVACSQCCWYV